jgi:fibronectin type III domain protein
MERKKILIGMIGGLAATSLILSSALVAEGDSANPTRAEALAGVSAARTYVQQHPGDTGETEALAGADALSGYITSHVDPTTPPPTTTSPPATSPFPQNVTAVAGANKVTLSWTAPTEGTPTGYIYGRGGTDSTGTGPWTSDVQSASLRSVVLDKLVNGTPYTVFVEAVYSSGNKRVTLTATPGSTVTTPPTTTTPPPTTTTPPTSGRASGLPWSSGSNPQSQDKANVTAFSAARGAQVDNITLHPPRNSWSTLSDPQWVANGLPSNFVASRDDLVMSVPLFPGNMSVSNTGSAAQWKAFANMVESFDPNAIIRLGWEMNGSWWPWNLNSSNQTQWRASFRQAVGWMKASDGAPGLQIAWNPNKGNDQTSGCTSTSCQRASFQNLKDIIQIYGIDSYDAYPADKTSSARSEHLAILNEGYNYAIANGKKFAVPEWGIACNTSGCQWQGNAGGDNPQYIHDYMTWFDTHTAGLAFESYFDEPDAYIRSALYRNAVGAAAGAQYQADIQVMKN